MYKRLFAPWRKKYINSLGKKRLNNLNNVKFSSNNFILEAWKNNHKKKEHLVVKKNDFGLIMLNRYPYVSGHLLVALGDPKPDLLSYSEDMRTEFWNLVTEAIEMVQETYSPQGINVGINQGEAGGAGLPSHLHAHVIPRYTGDTNFLTSVTGIRTIPESLEQSFDRYDK